MNTRENGWKYTYVGWLFWRHLEYFTATCSRTLQGTTHSAYSSSIALGGGAPALTPVYNIMGAHINSPLQSLPF